MFCTSDSALNLNGIESDGGHSDALTAKSRTMRYVTITKSY